VLGQLLGIGVERLVKLRGSAKVELHRWELETRARDGREVIGGSRLPDHDDQGGSRGQQLRGDAQGTNRGRRGVERNDHGA
jgi:hypothetical protein